MHQLILLRHAKALAATAGMADFARPLAEAGRHAAARIGQAMREVGLAPDVVLVSPAVRAQETMEAACVWDERPNIDSLAALYMATPVQILELLRLTPETVRSVLVIGHNPGLHELAKALAGGAAQAAPELRRLNTDFPTAGLAEFLVASSWAKLAPGTAALQRFLVPDNLKAA